MHSDRIAQLVGMSATRVDASPFIGDVNMDHWRVTLRRKDTGRTFSCFYSLGYGHKGRRPSAADVLECLVSDFTMHENVGGFWDYCDEYGITPSEYAEKNYRQGKRQSDRFFAWSRGALLRELLAMVEDN